MRFHFWYINWAQAPKYKLLLLAGFSSQNCLDHPGLLLPFFVCCVTTTAPRIFGVKSIWFFSKKESEKTGKKKYKGKNTTTAGKKHSKNTRKNVKTI